MSTLAVISCVSQKIWKKKPDIGLIPASEAYNSPYFKYNKRYVMLLKCPWIIMSAKYGLIKPNYNIEDYNEKLKKVTPEYKSMVQQQFSSLVKELNVSEVISMAGSKYNEVLEELCEETKIKFISPLEGVSIGKRLNFLKTAITELEKEFK